MFFTIQEKAGLQKPLAKPSQHDAVQASDFNYLAVLGKGSFGKVSKAKNEPNF